MSVPSPPPNRRHIMQSIPLPPSNRRRSPVEEILNIRTIILHCIATNIKRTIPGGHKHEDERLRFWGGGYKTNIVRLQLK